MLRGLSHGSIGDRRDVLANERRNIRSIVLELPPAPAALVLVGLALATLSARSAAAFRLIAVFGPPGGERLRPLLTPPAGEGEPGEDGCGEDYGQDVRVTFTHVPVVSKDCKSLVTDAMLRPALLVGFGLVRGVKRGNKVACMVRKGATYH